MSCSAPYIGLSLTSLALLISVCLNILLYSLRRREKQNKAVEEFICQDYCQSDRFEHEEEQINQDNPIYGNIHVDVAGPSRMTDVSYERMAKQYTRQNEKAEPTDISYASLDLSVNKKQKKKRKYPQKPNATHQAQTHSQPLARQSSLEFDPDSVGTLPSRTGSLMASCHSIYLNSHQIALETEERERERERVRERRPDHERETVNVHDDFELGFGQLDPSHEQDN